MRVDYESEEYLKGCIRSCQAKGHIQQVAFSTYHHALTQVCFTCEACRTSISHEEITGSKKATPITHFPDEEGKITRAVDEYYEKHPDGGMLKEFIEKAREKFGISTKNEPEVKDDGN